jgi:hypothetical protein
VHERRRNSISFHVRDDLRRAIEHLARVNGVSLSKQVEAYVEKCVLEDVVTRAANYPDSIDPVLATILNDEAPAASA